ncbi:MAG: hypothetical protein EBR40_00230 [Proteobacteria bacterium]|jgi:hypothetical protein|nr:hypothetical protein [Pseudomonadota bacterium]
MRNTIKIFYYFFLLFLPLKSYAQLSDLAIKGEIMSLEKRIKEMQPHVDANPTPDPNAGLKEDLITLMIKGDPSLKKEILKEQLKTMSDTDVRKLIYNGYRNSGKNIIEARELSEKINIPNFR